MKPVCVFDVNETLLDLAALDPYFERVFGDPGVRPLWFAQLLQSALVATVTGGYSEFARIGLGALEMVAARKGVDVSDADKQALGQAMRNLPPHPDVRAGLERLRDSGFRLATLTNSTADVGEAQLRSAGIRDFFEEALSADAVRRLKPAPEPYRMAAERLAVEVGDVLLVAAHAWDVAGALRAGCRSAFVARPGMVLDPLAERPEIAAPDVGAVAAEIIASAA